MNTRKSKLKVDGTSADDYLVASLSAFICSPLDMPKGPGGVIFLPSLIASTTLLKDRQMGITFLTPSRQGAETLRKGKTEMPKRATFLRASRFAPSRLCVFALKKSSCL